MNGNQQNTSLPEDWREVEEPARAAAVSHLLQKSSVGERVRLHLGVAGSRLTLRTNDLRREYDQMNRQERLLAEIVTHLWSGAFRVDLRRAADELSPTNWEGVHEALEIYRHRKT